MPRSDAPARCASRTAASRFETETVARGAARSRPEDGGTDKSHRVVASWCMRAITWEDADSHLRFRPVTTAPAEGWAHDPRRLIGDKVVLGHVKDPDGRLRFNL